jgi:hypothetical protein
MKNVKQYYKELGKLVYAVAIADGIVQPEERDKLHQFVLKELASNERTYDSSGMNQAFYVDFEFDESEKNSLSLNGTVTRFSEFIHENIEPNDKKLIERSTTLLEVVANAYSKKKEKSIVEQFINKTRTLIK